MHIQLLSCEQGSEAGLHPCSITFQLFHLLKAKVCIKLCKALIDDTRTTDFDLAEGSGNGFGGTAGRGEGLHSESSNVMGSLGPRVTRMNSARVSDVVHTFA